MLKIPKSITPILFTALISINWSSASASDIPENPTKLDFNYIHQRAKSGHPYYQCYMGIIYRTGYKNVIISYDKALYWTELAMEKKYPLAMANLGAIRIWEIDMVSSRGEKIQKRIEGLNLYEDAYFSGLERLANYGDPLAADLLADYYFLSSLPSPQKCEKYLRIAVEKGYPRSMAALGFYQITGLYRGIAKDKKEGIYHIERAAAQYLPEGLMNLATAYLKGDGVDKSREKAILLYKEASRRGLTLADKALAKVLKQEDVGNAETEIKRTPSVQQLPNTSVTQKPITKSEGNTPLPVPANSGDTASNWKSRAVQGEALAQRQVGLMYWLGKGVPKDLGKAKYWLEKAAAQGDSIADKRLKILNKIH